MKDKIGIYIHIPFCERKCNYCDFYSIKWNTELEKLYIDALISELNMYKNYKDNYVIDSIFIGGGTPSLIKESSINKIINEIFKLYYVDKIAEISIEANPNSLTKDKLISYRNDSINRLSIGVQSLDDSVLKTIGRVHNSEEAINKIVLAQNLGFDNINTDVMFNIPGQNVNSIETTINKLLDLDIPHISYYSLKIEENTPIYHMINKKQLKMPEEELERSMYYIGREILENNNLIQYEISNFSKRNYECYHNIKYWERDNYLGIGPAAHSFVKECRFSNIDNLEQYFELIKSGNKPVINSKDINKDEQIFEYIILGLRMTNGIDILQFKKTFRISIYDIYKEVIEDLVENKLIIIDNNNIKLTNIGMDVSNYVFTKFLL